MCLSKEMRPDICRLCRDKKDIVYQMKNRSMKNISNPFL